MKGTSHHGPEDNKTTVRQRIQINNKNVWVSQPYRPNLSVIPEFVGRESEMELIIAAWISGGKNLPLSPILIGDPGVGKNRLVYELASLTSRDLFVYQGHEDITAEDLACTIRFSDEEANKMEYVLSPLACAMMAGGIFFLDEIGKIRPRALALLVSVLDERRYLDSSLLGERIHAHPGFRFIAATNTGEVSLLPEFIRSRIKPVIKIGYPSRQEIDEIIQKQFRKRINNLAELLECFWASWNMSIKEALPPTPRDVITTFTLASSLSDLERHGGIGRQSLHKENEVLLLKEEAGDFTLSRNHLEKAIDKLLQRQDNEKKMF